MSQICLKIYFQLVGVAKISKEQVYSRQRKLKEKGSLRLSQFINT